MQTSNTFARQNIIYKTSCCKKQLGNVSGSPTAEPKAQGVAWHCCTAGCSPAAGDTQPGGLPVPTELLTEQTANRHDFGTILDIALSLRNYLLITGTLLAYCSEKTHTYSEVFKLSSQVFFSLCTYLPRASQYCVQSISCPLMTISLSHCNLAITEITTE